MTATTFSAYALDLRLPHVEYVEFPTAAQERHEYVVEQMVGFFTETDEPSLLRVLEVLTGYAGDELTARISELCEMSAAVEEWRNRPGHWPAFEASIDDYRTALSAMSTRPVTS